VKKVSAAKEYYLVTKVVDGDTLDLYINGTAERVRLIGIDTPEVVDPRKPVQCFGVEASDRAKAILTGQSVALEKDPSQGERDKYGRMLGYVFLKDGTNFNKQMILEGYAHEYTYNLPYKYQADFKAAEKYARENKLGLWDENVCPTSTPTTTDQNTTSNLNTNTASSAPAANEPAGHIFYTSSYPTAKLYYCDTDSNWKNLSSRYLKSFSSEQELLAAYSRTLHEPCK
jgi:micrococcal nuclease